MVPTRPKVVVLGGGFGGLEATFYLRHKLGDAVDLTLVSERDYFLFRPNTIYITWSWRPAPICVRVKSRDWPSTL
jgi:sulfide:quinone oxidoreductase